MKRPQHGGYIGLVTLIVSVAIIALLFARMYLYPKEENPNAEFQPLTASGTVPGTGIEEMHADVDAANAVKVQLNKQNAETQAEMDRLP